MSSNGSKSIGQDFKEAVTSATLMTATLNPMFVWQNNKIASGSTYFTASRMYDGALPNWTGFLLTMGVARVGNGFLKRCFEEGQVDQPFIKQVIVPCFAAGGAGFCVTPTEMVALRENQTGLGTIRTVKRILRTEGVRAFWKGGLATVWRDSIAVSAVVLGPKLKKNIQTYTGLQDFYATAASSVVVGAGAIGLTQWAQVSRVMLQSIPGKSILPGETQIAPLSTLSATVTRIWNHMGWKGFFLSGGRRFTCLVGMSTCEIIVSEWYSK